MSDTDGIKKYTVIAISVIFVVNFVIQFELLRKKIWKDIF